MVSHPPLGSKTKTHLSEASEDGQARPSSGFEQEPVRGKI
jgi:hypothetical protein